MSQDGTDRFECQNCGEEWVNPFTAIVGHSECVPEGEEPARVIKVEGSS